MWQMSRRRVSCLGWRGDLMTVVVWRGGLWCLSGGWSFGAWQSFHSRCLRMHHQPNLSLQEPHRPELSGWVGRREDGRRTSTRRARIGVGSTPKARPATRGVKRSRTLSPTLNPQTFKTNQQTTNTRPRTPNPKHQTPDPKFQTPNFKPQTTDSKLQTPNSKPQTPDPTP